MAARAAGRKLKVGLTARAAWEQFEGDGGFGDAAGRRKEL
jgi:hypothetical protein